MSRSPYEAAPRYVTCGYCGGKHDETRPHHCDARCRELLRGLVESHGEPHVRAALDQVSLELAEQRRVQARLAASCEVSRLVADCWGIR